VNRVLKPWRWLTGSAPELLWTRGVFLRCLGTIYAVAFASFWWQAEGLVGSRGIWPFQELFALYERSLGSTAAVQALPSVLWLDPTDRSLGLLCASGVTAGVLLSFGLFPRPLLAVLWLGYLSVVSVGSVFLSFQWDVLLLEVGVLAFFVAPRGWRLQPLLDEPPSRLSVLLLWGLLFRLYFLSAWVKLQSQDPTWRSLSALDFHFWTQPLPNPASLWVATWPHALLKALALGMFLIEGLLPFFFFGPTRVRRVAGILALSLQLGIFLTGNYGFFNLLSGALCLLLLDDLFWARLLPSSWTFIPRRPDAVSALGPLEGAALVGLLLLAGVETVQRMAVRTSWPAAVATVQRWVRPFHLVSSYGLFAVMTTDRPEISLEGTQDGQQWKPYVFRWKPGALDELPGQVAPHMPRLDWQMWFAALGSCDQNPWFLRFQERLLQGSAPVLGLMEKDPFPGSQPLALRSRVRLYRPAPAGSPNVWVSTQDGSYCPEVVLRQGRLRRVAPGESLR
jgi:lipase maturation factor 1